MANRSMTLLRAVTDRTVELQNIRTNQIAVLGLDHIYGYTSDPLRDTATTRHGFLNLLVEIMVRDTEITIEPLPPPRQGQATAFRGDPLVVPDGDRERYFSWRDRDPVHLIPTEEQPRQLYAFFRPLCQALRQASGHEPEFQMPDDIRGEVVYELSPDIRARWQLLGGMGGKPGKAVLVLTEKPARALAEEIKTPRVEPQPKWVSSNYATQSGLQQRLESEGYIVTWSVEEKLSERLAEGCELVVLEEDGKLVVPKIKDTFITLTLVKRRR